MNTREFDELGGRIEGLARAVLILARMMERETDMDGLTLSRQWRESVPPEPGSGTQDTARKTLHELAQALDDARSRHQQSLVEEKFRLEEQARVNVAPPSGQKAPGLGPQS